MINFFRNLFRPKPNATISLGYGEVMVAACLIEGHEGILFIPSAVGGQPGTDVPPAQWPKKALEECVLIRFRDRAAADHLIETIEGAYKDDKPFVTTVSGRFREVPDKT